MSHVFECPLGSQALTIETGRLAGQAGGSVTVRYGDSIVLVTACAASEPREGTDFLPLTVDFEERHYAAGKIPGSFIRRESRPSQQAVLTDRLIDRSLRPLFPKGYRNETQVVVTVLSTDQENDPDILALIGASASLLLSPLPFADPVSAVRVGRVDGELVLNPTFTQLNESDIDIVVASTSDAVIMLEASGNEIAEGVAVEAVRLAFEANLEVIRLQRRMREQLGKEKMAGEAPSTDTAVMEAVSSVVAGRLSDAVGMPRQEREAFLDAIEEELAGRLGEEFTTQQLSSALDALLRDAVRKSILEKGTRAGGRRPDEIRPITCEVGFLPRTHGSGLFTRGATQVMTITTLGSMGERQLIDTISPEETKRFLHHYNFPAYSVGEVRRIGAPSRREIGHGALAERALEPVIPSGEEFPYTIRLVSEVLSSNGSTSMGSVCSSILALMDAGVPIKGQVAGVAMGLVTGDGRHRVLTDIEGLEDAYGDMDFKVAGTANGITVIQMDTKLKGLSLEVVEETLERARQARLVILGVMNQTISESRPELSKYAPRMYRITIDPEKIGSVIGPGGRMIRSIIEETKTTIDIENDGTVLIGSANEEGAKKAIKIIEGLTRDVEVGTVYTGRVTRIMNFGAFVELFAGKEGLVHISELADYRVPSVEDVVKVGDEITVMVTEIDRMGRINLSRRAVFQDKGQPPEEGGKGAPDTGQRRPQGQPRPQGDARGGASGPRDSRPPRRSGPRRPASKNPR